MSRWDSLKPESRASSKPTSNRNARTQNLNQHQQETPLSSRQRSVQSQSDWRRGTNARSEATFKGHLDVLKQLLCRYKDGTKGDQSSQILKGLDELSKFSPSTKDLLSTSRFEGVVVLIGLLQVHDDANICQGIASSLMNLLTGEKRVSLTASQAIHGATVLSNKCKNSSLTTIFIEPLAMWVGSQVNHLPAEKTAQEIVAQVLLPFLESKPTTSARLVISIHQALSALLQHSKHASALLAPLVQDVTAEGKERKIINPLRPCIFALLQ
jgi:hypothetical protein